MFVDGEASEDDEDYVPGGDNSEDEDEMSLRLHLSDEDEDDDDDEGQEEKEGSVTKIMFGPMLYK